MPNIPLGGAKTGARLHGLNRGDVEQERHLHFWQDPLRK